MEKWIVGVVSQKGGVGKSSLAKLLAVEYARAGLKTLLADMDTSQKTAVAWQQRRLKNNIQPVPDVGSYLSVQDTLRSTSAYGMVVFDGAPHATRMTKELADVSNLVILPTGNSIEDLEPQVTLAHELVETGVPRERLLFVLSRAGESVLETREVMHYLHLTGYAVLSAQIPERTVFRRMAAEGKTLTETPYKVLNQRCEEAVQEITNRLTT